MELTTGQMIDKLKTGQIATCINPPERLTVKQKQVVKGEHMLMWCDGIEFKVTSFVSDEAKWIINPQYVSFEEAMKALKDGKTINSYLGEKVSEFSLNHGGYLPIMCEAVKDGKWSIKD